MLGSLLGDVARIVTIPVDIVAEGVEEITDLPVTELTHAKDVAILATETVIEAAEEKIEDAIFGH